jgi:hypothetical protein
VIDVQIARGIEAACWMAGRAQWIDAASVQVEVLPADPAAGEAALYATQGS